MFTKIETEANNLAYQYHKNQIDKSGEMYFSHVYKVAWNAGKMFPKDRDILSAIGYLHDILEDTDCPEELILEKCGQRVLDGVKAMTKIKGESYDDYLDRLCKNPDAVKVKYCDLIHNMDLTRLNTELTDKDLQRIKKYYNAYLRLKQLI